MQSQNAHVVFQGHEDEFPDCAMLHTRYPIWIKIHLPDLASRVDYLARPRRGPTHEYWRHLQEDQRRSQSRYQGSSNVQSMPSIRCLHWDRSLNAPRLVVYGVPTDRFSHRCSASVSIRGPRHPSPYGHTRVPQAGFMALLCRSKIDRPYTGEQEQGYPEQAPGKTSCNK